MSDIKDTRRVQGTMAPPPPPQGPGPGYPEAGSDGPPTHITTKEHRDSTMGAARTAPAMIKTDHMMIDMNGRCFKPGTRGIGRGNPGPGRKDYNMVLINKHRKNK